MAEAVFLNFKKSKAPYAMCKEILEKSRNDYVLFQVASTLKESVVREWSLLQPGDAESLRNFLLHYVTSNVHLQNYVREQMLQAVAVIVKRGTVDAPSANRENLFNDITQLVSSGNLSMQLVACSILTALLNEYSSTGRSSSVGLTWEFHSKCKAAFEQEDLKQVLGFVLQVLYELDRVPAPLPREVAVVLNRFLNIAQQLLSWEFTLKHPNRRFVGSFSSAQNVSFRPPATWRDMVLNHEFVSMMFRLQKKVRYNSDMAHHALQCLAQMASINGPVIDEDDKVKAEYLRHFVLALLELISG